MKQLHLFDREQSLPKQEKTDFLSQKSDETRVPSIQEIRVLGEHLASRAQDQSAESQSKVVSPKKTCAAHWKLFVDGAARNNPGPAGAGFYLLKDGQEYAKKGYYLGSRTNNQAEYCALLLGLHFLKDHIKSGDCVHIVSDSQLLVRQLKGEYKIKSPELRPLYALAYAFIQMMRADIFHVLRTDNAQADRMANKGIDTKRSVSEDFIKMLHAHGISW